MQIGKFTIFDFVQLQDPTKRQKYQEIISWATSEKNRYTQRTELNYATRRANKMRSPISITYYIKRANELINRNWELSPVDYIPLKTATEKMLFITNFVFPDNQKFIDILKQYEIENEMCINFGEEIKDLGFYNETKTEMILDLLIREYFPDLNQIKMHYGTNNTSLIINKILEIAYLHPELLHTKEKS